MCKYIKTLFEDDKFHWQWYKTFFNVVILRYLITWFAIVPIIASFLTSLKLDVKFAKSVEINFVSNDPLPFSLQLLWLSALFFVMALLLYQWLCPGFIKTYSSYGDYKERCHSPRWIIWEALKVINDKTEIDKLFERLNEKGFIEEGDVTKEKNIVETEKMQTVAYFKFNNKPYKLALPILTQSGQLNRNQTEHAEREIFWEIFGRFSSSKKVIRVIIISLLFISGVLFLITLGEHIWHGFQFVWQSYKS